MTSDKKQNGCCWKDIMLMFNPKQAKGGRNQDAASLDALPVQQGKGTIIKPPCICNFAYPKQFCKFQSRIHLKSF